MVLEWAALHQQELLDNWQRCRVPEPPRPIAPPEDLCADALWLAVHGEHDLGG